MSRLILTKRISENPLYVELSGISIWSMQELCYYLCNYIYAIDGSFFDEAFFAFLKKLDENELIEKLNMDLLSGKHYTELAADVIRMTDYYSDEEKKAIQKSYETIRNCTPAQNRKAKADILRERGKYAEAIEEYNLAILENEMGSPEITADVWNNIGVMEAMAFHYRQAMICFGQALDIQQKQEYLDNMICAILLSDKEDKELAEKMIVKYQISHTTLQKYRAVIEIEEKKIRASEQTIAFQKEASLEEQKDVAVFYRKTGEIMKEWKRKYREQEKERQSK